MEKIIEQGILYDFYGELLTAHQRKIYEDAVYNDFSLGEIAETEGITRQGVHDLIKRCDKILLQYEEKLHLVERFSRTRKTVSDIVELTEKATALGAIPAPAQETLLEIKQLSNKLLEEL